MKKLALVTGVRGQDGSYLAELLLDKNYIVIGLCKGNNLPITTSNNIKYIQADITHAATTKAIIEKHQPDEIYNLASQSSPGQSWQYSLETGEVNGIAAHRLFDIIREIKPNCKIFQASTSDMYGENSAGILNEQTPFKPNNPYSVAKLYAHNIAGIYRNHHKMFISCGILFNHESPKRGINFITQKITYAAACLKLGVINSPLTNEQNEPIVKEGKLRLGNLEASRDWGYAKEYVEAMWLMLQQEKSDDYLIATGKLHTIRELCKTAFSYVGLDWQEFVTTDPRLIRPAETKIVNADPSKAKKILGWQARLPFKDMIALMVDYHLSMLKK